MKIQRSGLWLRLEPELDQAADGLGARHRLLLLCHPAIDRLDLSRLIRTSTATASTGGLPIRLFLIPAPGLRATTRIPGLPRFVPGGPNL